MKGDELMHRILSECLFLHKFDSAPKKLRPCRKQYLREKLAYVKRYKDMVKDKHTDLGIVEELMQPGVRAAMYVSDKHWGKIGIVVMSNNIGLQEMPVIAHELQHVIDGTANINYYKRCRMVNDPSSRLYHEFRAKWVEEYMKYKLGMRHKPPSQDDLSHMHTQVHSAYCKTFQEPQDGMQWLRRFL